MFSFELFGNEVVSMADGEKFGKEFWWTIGINNKGKVAKDVRAYIDCLDSNHAENPTMYRSMQLRPNFLKIQHIPSWPKNEQFDFALCYVSSIRPHRLYFNFDRTPNAFRRVRYVDKPLTYKFRVKVIAADSDEVSDRIVDVSFGGNYKTGFVVK